MTNATQALNIYFQFLIKSHLERHFLSVFDSIILSVKISLPFHLLQVWYKIIIIMIMYRQIKILYLQSPLPSFHFLN